MASFFLSCVLRDSGLFSRLGGSTKAINLAIRKLCFSRSEFPIKIIGFCCWEIEHFSDVQMIVFPSRFVALEYKTFSRFRYTSEVTLLAPLNCSQYLRTSSYSVICTRDPREYFPQILSRSPIFKDVTVGEEEGEKHPCGEEWYAEKVIRWRHGRPSDFRWYSGSLVFYLVL